MKKILIVEDNELNRDTLSERLMRQGYAVVTATNGVEGVSKAQFEQPDLIIMDMSMPIMDGWEATRRIRASVEIYNTPIIALTAHGTMQDKQRCLDAGCDEFEVKPAEFSQLLIKVEKLLARADFSLSS